MLVTNRRIMQPSFEAALEAALRGGARWIQLREKELEPQNLMELALQAQQLCTRYGAMLSINSRADVARAAHAAGAHAVGVHLPETGIAPYEARLALQAGALVGQSVHSVRAAERATREGADYLVFGSVFPTASHPGGAAQELEALREVTAATKLPVYAIGGIDASRIKPCRKAGAYGVAVLGAAWQGAAGQDGAGRDGAGQAGDVSDRISVLVQAVEATAPV
jgi:thiamine-phosphate pyrophosphorylase